MLALLSKASGGTDIVTTIDASMGIEQMGFQVRRTKVGDPYISEELKQGGQFGGETSGAWVFPQISLCPDGIYGAAQIAGIAGRGKLSDVVDSIPVYPVVRSNVTGVVKMSEVQDKLADQMRPDSVVTIDGIKLNFKDGWLLVRPSGTEPKIRISAEGQDEKVARSYLEYGVRIVQEALLEGKK
jgi:phosphoglucosamine mutase